MTLLTYLLAQKVRAKSLQACIANAVYIRPAHFLGKCELNGNHTSDTLLVRESGLWIFAEWTAFIMLLQVISVCQPPPLVTEFEVVTLAGAPVIDQDLACTH